MLRKETILKTAVCYFSPADECYVVESPLFQPVIAAEKTPEKAVMLYKSMLNGAYEALLKDRVHGFKRGRPAKHGTELHIQVKSETKLLIEDLRREIGISQGEFVDLMVFYYAKNIQPAMTMQTSLTLETTIGDLIVELKQAGTEPQPARPSERFLQSHKNGPKASSADTKQKRTA